MSVAKNSRVPPAPFASSPRRLRRNPIRRPPAVGAAGLAHHELRLEHHAPAVDRDVLRRDLLQQELDRVRDDLVDRLRDRRERRVGRRGERDVVVPDHREVLRDAAAGPARRLEDAEREDVGRRGHGGDVGPRPQDRLAHRRRVLEVELPGVGHQLVVVGHARVGQRAAIALLPELVERPVDEADAPVPEALEVRDRAVHAVHVLDLDDRHADEVGRHVAVDEHRRHAGRQDLLDAVGRTSDDDAVAWVPEEQVDVVRLGRGRVVRRAAQDRVAAGAAAVVDRLDQLAQERVAEQRDDHPDRRRALAAEVGRDPVRAVADLSRDAADARGRLLADGAVSLEGVRHRRGRHAGRFRDVPEGHS